MRPAREGKRPGELWAPCKGRGSSWRCEHRSLHAHTPPRSWIPTQPSAPGSDPASAGKSALVPRTRRGPSVYACSPHGPRHRCAHCARLLFGFCPDPVGDDWRRENRGRVSSVPRVTAVSYSAWRISVLMQEGRKAWRMELGDRSQQDRGLHDKGPSVLLAAAQPSTLSPSVPLTHTSAQRLR